jgi:hypothetical protein
MAERVGFEPSPLCLIEAVAAVVSACRGSSPPQSLAARSKEKFGQCREIARFLSVAAFGAGNHRRWHTISTLSICDFPPRSAPNRRYSRVCH